jgi:hypothetical protein
LVLIVALLSESSDSQAQQSRRLELSAGTAILGLPHQNTGFVGSLRFTSGIGGGVFVGSELSLIRASSRLHDKVTFVATEAILLAEVSSNRIRPFLGGALGLVACCGGVIEPTFHAMEGVRADLNDRSVLFLDVRERLLPEGAFSFELAIGFSWRL